MLVRRHNARLSESLDSHWGRGGREDGGGNDQDHRLHPVAAWLDRVGCFSADASTIAEHMHKTALLVKNH